jgi:hypothetical protein
MLLVFSGQEVQVPETLSTRQKGRQAVGRS